MMKLELEDPDPIDWQRVLIRLRRLFPRSLPVVAVNLVPLFGVIFLDWKPVALYVLFCLETVVIVVVELARLNFVQRARRGMRLDRAMASVVFLAISLMFTGGQLLLIIFLMGSKEWQAIQGGNLFEDFAAFVDSLGLWYAAGLVAVLHVIDVVRLGLGRPARGEAEWSEGPIMASIRMIALNFILIVAFVPTIIFGTPTWALVVLIAAKIALEVLMREYLGGTVTSTFTGGTHRW